MAKAFVYRAEVEIGVARVVQTRIYVPDVFVLGYGANAAEEFDFIRFDKTTLDCAKAELQSLQARQVTIPEDVFARLSVYGKEFNKSRDGVNETLAEAHRRNCF